ncbi:MAG: DUF2092 domain-containing protein [Kiritimatiellaeota bacterium]|nr:DUF2092 domain-containing protein [Kiritimatiellota bacterium]
MHRIKSGWWPMVCAVALNGAAGTWAQNPAAGVSPPEAAPRTVEPKAGEVLQKMSDFYRGLQSLRLDLEVQLHMQADGLKQALTSSWAIALARPNRLAIRHTAGQGAFHFICDGSNTFVFFPANKRYLQQPALASIASYFEGETEPGNLLQHGIPFFATLISPQPYQQLLADVARVQYVGTEMWQGAECHRVRGLQKQFDWDMWLETGQQPLVRKVLMDMSKGMLAAAAAAPQMTNAQWQMEILFNRYDVNTPVAHAAFQFTPPVTAKKVATFRPQQQEEGPPPLLGKPAPALNLDLLDGGKLSLAKHQGQDVVVLDFWATWCGPCRRSLPVLAGVAARYHGRGVAVYAVNQREPVATIKDFLAKEKIILTVALDREGVAGEGYGVEGIPQTVVIGKDGVVQAVHVGFAPDLKETLCRQLDDLLAGKSLVTPAPPAAPASKPGL